MVREVECADIENQGDILLIDVREQDEWDAGHIKGAQHIPLSALKDDPGLFTPPDAGKTCVLYCRRGVRSQTAASLILAAGRDGGADLASLRGGYEAWTTFRQNS